MVVVVVAFATTTYKVKCVGAAICGYCISLICSRWRMSREERERRKFGNSREDQLAAAVDSTKMFWRRHEIKPV